MSERGTLVTSFFYDPTYIPALQEVLPRYTREGCLLWAMREAPDVTPYFAAGLMHGCYGGEEAIQDMNNLIEDLLPLLPQHHGQFSITVMPEWAEYTRTVTFKDAKVESDWWIDSPANAERKEFAAEMEARAKLPRLNISEMARKDLTPPTE